eukprot:scaffold2885_cov65-Phaeocystis_antarctica.AAC.3
MPVSARVAILRPQMAPLAPTVYVWRGPRKAEAEAPASPAPMYKASTSTFEHESARCRRTPSTVSTRSCRHKRGWVKGCALRRRGSRLAVVRDGFAYVVEQVHRVGVSEAGGQHARRREVVGAQADRAQVLPLLVVQGQVGRGVGHDEPEHRECVKVPRGEGAVEHHFTQLEQGAVEAVPPGAVEVVESVVEAPQARWVGHAVVRRKEELRAARDEQPEKCVRVGESVSDDRAHAPELVGSAAAAAPHEAEQGRRVAGRVRQRDLWQHRAGGVPGREETKAADHYHRRHDHGGSSPDCHRSDESGARGDEREHARPAGPRVGGQDRRLGQQALEGNRELQAVVLHGELAVTVRQHGHRHSHRRVLRGRATRRALQPHLGGRLQLDRLASDLRERAEGSDRYVAPRGRLARHFA